MFAAKNELLTRPNGGYSLTRSLRIRKSASAYLNRTPASAGNRQIFTLSVWLKLGSIISADAYIISANTASGFNDGFGISFTSSGSLGLSATAGGGTVADVSTSQLFRDPAAWYHIIFAIDTTQATSSNRVKIYINGNQTTLSGTYPAQNTNFQINNSVPTYFGRLGYTSAVMFDGYLAEVNFIDGQALTPSSFGAYSIYNQWLPKKYAGTYGTNGFYLPFTNNASAATLGNDFSGNSNTWTTNNISVTSGSTYDSMTDVPTLTSATAANFATLNPLTGGSSTTSDGNLAATIAPVNGARVSTIAVTSGKFYCEMVATTVNGYFVMGIGAPYSKGWDTSQESSPNSITWATSGASSPYVQAKGSWTLSSNTISTTYTTGDVVGIALNMDSNTLTFYKNGTSQGSMTINTQGIPAAFLIGNSSGASNGAGYVNFGQRPFAYTPPSGYVALNTFNL